MATATFPQRTTLAEIYAKPPPAFGHEMRTLFGFDPNYINLNNGSYGALSLPVRIFCDALTDEIESSPDTFIRIKRVPRWNLIRERVSKFIGAQADECVLVGNASQGIATILRNFTFNEGDILIGATTTYGSISQALKCLADSPSYPTLSTFNLQFPTTHAKIVQNFKEHIKRLTAIPDTTGQRKIIAIVDAIVSRPGALLPWKEMVAICRDAGVISIVDAAHSIGQELDINLSEARPDFWISDCHKWMYAKRSVAVLYVPKRNQHLIKTPIPTPASYNSSYDKDYKGPQDFIKMFEYNGTIDYIPQMSIDAALDFREWLGGERKINEYTHALAVAGGERLASHLGTSVMDTDSDYAISMVNVELPVSGEIESSDAILQMLIEILLLDWHTYVSPYRHNGKWWVRCSAQIWNEISDFDIIADALKDMCAKLKRSSAHKSKL